MKNTIKEFINSIYSPVFYAQISNKSLKNIFKYMFRIDLIVSAIAFVIVSIYFALNLNLFGDVPLSTFVVSSVVGVLSSVISIFLTVFIIWIIYGWIFGIIILGVSMIFKKNISYTVSVKIALYAMSLGVILSIIPFLPFGSLIGIAAPILIVLINVKK